jgi:hypothetical protein
MFPRYLVHDSVEIPDPMTYAEGSFGLVYEGLMDGYPVAVKILRQNVSNIPVKVLVGVRPSPTGSGSYSFQIL